MARSTLFRPFLFLIAAVGAGLLGACAKDATAPPPPPPLAPETELTYAPLEGDTSSFRVRFFWNGSDLDGEVVNFHFGVDQDTLLPPSEWPSTVSKDTTLLFLVDPVKEIKGHVISVAAEDNAGYIDPTPAKRFQVSTCSVCSPGDSMTSGPSVSTSRMFGSV